MTFASVKMLSKFAATCYFIALICHTLPKLISSRSADTIMLAYSSKSQVASNLLSRSDLQIPVRKAYLRKKLIRPDQSSPSQIYQSPSRLCHVKRTLQSLFMIPPDRPEKVSNKIELGSTKLVSTRVLEVGGTFRGRAPTRQPSAAAVMTEQPTWLSNAYYGLPVTSNKQPSMSPVTTATPSDIVLTVLPIMVQLTKKPSMSPVTTATPSDIVLTALPTMEQLTKKPSMSPVTTATPSDIVLTALPTMEQLTKKPSMSPVTTATPSDIVLTALPTMEQLTKKPSMSPVTTATPSDIVLTALPTMEQLTKKPSMSPVTTATPSDIVLTALPTMEQLTKKPSMSPVTTATPSDIVLTALPTMEQLTQKPSMSPVTTATPSDIVLTALPTMEQLTKKPSMSPVTTATPSDIVLTALPTMEQLTKKPSMSPVTTATPSDIVLTALPTMEQLTQLPSMSPVTTATPSDIVLTALPTMEQLTQLPSMSPVTTATPSDIVLTALPTMEQLTQLPSMYVTETEEPASDQPTQLPSMFVTETEEPASDQPTQLPSMFVTETEEPASDQPTQLPSMYVTETEEPASDQPTQLPSMYVTETEEPASDQPTQLPSMYVTETEVPASDQPTQLPSMYVTETEEPASDQPTQLPSMYAAETEQPTASPTEATAAPSRERRVATSSPSARKGATIIVVQILSGTLDQTPIETFTLKFEQAISRVTGALPSDVEIMIIRLDTASTIGITYTVSSRNITSAAMSSSLLQSIPTKQLSAQLYRQGLTHLSAVALPSVVLSSTAPTLSPTALPQYSPSKAPTSAPSVIPIRPFQPRSSRKPTSAPSRQPTSYPSGMYPEQSTYRQISFYGHNDLYGVRRDTFLSPLAVLDFRVCISNLLDGIRLMDVVFVNATFTEVSTSSANLRERESATDRKESHSLSHGPRTHLELSSRDLATPTSLTKVVWGLTVPLVHHGMKNESAVYARLRTQLMTAVDDDALLENFRAVSSLLNETQSLTLKLDPYTLVTVSTPTATPTSSPTIISIIPAVSMIEVVSITRDTVTADVTLVKLRTAVGDTTGGYLYCIALKNGSSPSTVGQLKSATFDGADTVGTQTRIPGKAKFPLTLNVEFDGLKSMRSYAIFCYVENSIGAGNSLSAVLSTKTVASTECCNDVYFAYAPVFVYGDVMKQQLSDPASYIFTFVLSDAPTTDVTLDIIVSQNGEVSSTVYAVPSVFSFTNQSSLSGQLYITGPPTTGGSFSVGFGISGPSSSEFTGYSAAVQVLSSSTRTPAPKMFYSRFTDSGQSVLIQFKTPTDYAGITATTWPCNILFSFVSDSQTSCTWIDSSTVSASFGVVTTVEDNVIYLSTGDTITLLPGLIRAFCPPREDSSDTLPDPDCLKNPTANTKTTLTLAPLNPSSPTVYLVAPAFLGSCDSLYLDATGSYGNGGRLYTSVRWTVSAMEYGAVRTVVNVTSLEKQLNAFSALHQVYKPAIIANRDLLWVTYTITVSLTNFLGLQSSKTTTLTVVRDPFLPALSIIGPSYRSVVAAEGISILSTVTLSSCCPEGTVVTYSWAITLEGLQVGLPSTSLDPTRFSLGAYSLLVDNTYKITVTATAGKSSTSQSVSVYVAHGAVTADIMGGLTRFTPIDAPLVLDASGSTDADVSPYLRSTLSYLWTCAIRSRENFGSSCSIKWVSRAHNSVISLPPYGLSENITYAFTVQVSSLDGRTSTQTAVVTPTVSGSAQMTITSTLKRFNEGARVVLVGNLFAPYAVTSQWTIRTPLGIPVLFGSLTPQQRTFNTSDALAQIAYPLSVNPYSLPGGSTYVFRLSVHPTSNPHMVTFAEIALNSNPLPTGGYITPNPVSGDALVTLFTIASPGWTADAACFPLSLSFAYALSPTSAYYTLAAPSLRGFTTATLPAGISSLGYLITLFSAATDIFNSSGNATATVMVKTKGNVNLTRILDTSLNTAFSAGNVNLAFQTINNVASMVNAINCTLAPDCRKLNRAFCFSVAGSCGACLPGYKGMPGDSNTKCHSSSSLLSGTVKTVGSQCTTNKDCMYNLCAENVCSAPPLTCPTSIPGKICSGNGFCRYSDPSGNILSSCSIINPTCTASCACSPQSGYGGADCSINAEVSSARDLLRSALCQALVVAGNVQDRSPSLLNTLSMSLLSSFSPSEVASDSAKTQCSAALLLVSGLARDGHVGGSAETSQCIAELVSSYAILGPSSRNGSVSGRQFIRSVATAADGLIKSIQLGKTGGENPTVVVTENVQIVVTSELISFTDSSHLSTPPMKYRSEGAAVQPTVAIGPDGLSACSFRGGYAHMSVLKWTKNPYGQSKSVKSPLLRFSLAPLHATESLESPFDPSRGASGRRKLGGNNTVPTTLSFNLSGEPAYRITLQFSRKIDFNFSATVDLALKSKQGKALNYTLPACTLYNGVKYVPCRGCNISSFTNYNVTYACFDIHQLCPKVPVLQKMNTRTYSAPYLRSYSHGHTNVRDGGGEMERTGEEEKGEDKGEREGDWRGKEGEWEGEGEWGGRYLGDEKGVQDVTARTYGVLLQSVIEELSTVLSSNPFALNLQANKTILCFVSLLGGFIVTMIIYLMRVDHEESVERRYMGEECEAAVRDHIVEDIKNGGRGDLGASFQQYSRQYKDERRASSSVIGSINRIKRRGTLFDSKEGSPTKSVTVNCMHIGKYDISPSAASSKRVMMPDSIQEGDEEVEDGDDRTDDYASEKGSGEGSGKGSVKSGPLQRHSESEVDDSINEEDAIIATKAALTGFLHKLFPGRSIFAGNRNLLQVISVYHDYFCMFAGSELTKTRTVRFLSVVCVVLPTIFTDTVFFGIYFPAVSVCQTYTDEVSCLRAPSKVQAGASLCNWTAASRMCTNTSPPTDPVFIVLVALITILLGLPIVILLRLALFEYGSIWPGSNGSDDEVHAKEKEIAEEEHRGAQGSLVDSVEEGKKNKEVGHTTDSDSDSENDKGSDNAALQVRSAMAPSQFGQVISAGISGRAKTLQGTTLLVYNDFLTPGEEATMIIELVKKYLAKLVLDTYLPWECALTMSTQAAIREIKVKAIEEQLGVLPNGDWVPLTTRQFLSFGTPHAKLTYKMAKVHLQTKVIIDELETYKPWEVDEKDMKLIRFFIIECLSPFKRYTLRINNHAYDKSRAKKSTWPVYITSWVFITCTLCFFMYWIFAWGVYNGEDTVSAWGMAYGTGAAKDILLVQVTKIFVLYYLPARSMQEQLVRIRSVLSDISMSYINRQRDEEIQESESHTTSGFISVVQHLSAACRASRSVALRDLPASWLLRQMDDVDAQKCREGRLNYRGTLSYLMIALPMTLLLFNEDLGDLIIDAVIPSMYSAVLVTGAVLFKISLIAALLPYAIVILVSGYFSFVYRSSIIAHAHRQAESRHLLREVNPSLNLNRSKKSHDDTGAQNYTGTDGDNTVQSGKRSSSSRLYRYFNRLLRLAGHSFQDLVTVLSHHQVSVFIERHSRERALWRDMNRAPYNQGTVVPNAMDAASDRSAVLRSNKEQEKEQEQVNAAVESTEAVTSHSDTDTHTNMNMNTQSRRPLSVPFEISRMIPYNNIEEIISQGAGKVTAEFAHILSETINPIIVSRSSNKKLVQRSTKSHILYETEEALTDMENRLSRHSSARHMHGKLQEVSSEELFKDLEDTLERYYPTGLKLTQDQKVEACKQFHIWRIKEGKIVNLSIVGDSTVEVAVCSYIAFRLWFSSDLLKALHSVKRVRTGDVRSQREKTRTEGRVARYKSALHIIPPMQPTASSSVFFPELHSDQNDEPSPTVNPIHLSTSRSSDTLSNLALADTPLPAALQDSERTNPLPTIRFKARSRGTSQIWPGTP